MYLLARLTILMFLCGLSRLRGILLRLMRGLFQNCRSHKCNVMRSNGTLKMVHDAIAYAPYGLRVEISHMQSKTLSHVSEN